jgi:hypothetical protein
MKDYLRFLIAPHGNPNDQALRTAHLAAISLFAALIASVHYRRTT